MSCQVPGVEREFWKRLTEAVASESRGESWKEADHRRQGLRQTEQHGDLVGGLVLVFMMYCLKGDEQVTGL